MTATLSHKLAKAKRAQSLNSDAAIRAWDDAYALKHQQPHVVEVPARYWLAALPAVLLCIALLVICPNPVVMP